MQFTVVVAIKVRASDVGGEVEVVLIDSCQVKVKSSKVAGSILTFESELSSKIITRLLGADLTRVGSKHGALPVGLLAIAQEIKSLDVDIAKRHAASTNG